MPTREDNCKKVKEKAIPTSLVSHRLVSPCFLLRKKNMNEKEKQRHQKHRQSCKNRGQLGVAGITYSRETPTKTLLVLSYRCTDL